MLHRVNLSHWCIARPDLELGAKMPSVDGESLRQYPSRQRLRSSRLYGEVMVG